VLIRLLQGVSDATPQMLVDDLHLHSLISAGNTAAPLMQASFVIYAYRAETGRRETQP
jgi:hypothetical protein